jgi:L-iditol 2-dehydrogenase
MRKTKRFTLERPGNFILEEVEYPSPRDGEVLIKVKRCGICGSDISAFFGKHPYIHTPIVLGHEFSGLIEEVGPNVSNISPGMRVTVLPHVPCGKCDACRGKKYNYCEELKVLGAQTDGAFSQYISVPSEMVFPLPDSMSLEDAALVEPASVGYHAAKLGHITSYDNILIFGAGPIGIFTMQSCKVFSAETIGIVDIDDDRLILAKRLGADYTINPNLENINEKLEKAIGGRKKLSLFFDCVGREGDVLDKIFQLAPRGSKVVVVGVLSSDYNIPHLPDFVEHELFISGSTMYIPKDYTEVIDLINSKRIRTDGIISHYYNFEQIPEAFNMIVNRKEKFFKVIIKINEGGNI